VRVEARCDVVGEPRAAVTDTHAVLFHASGRWSRGATKAQAHFDACERRQAITYVPAAVIWEVSLLARVAKVELGRPVRQFFGDLFSNPAYQPVDITPEIVYLADETRPNDDPFDALICATARLLDLPLLSRDEAIRASRVVPLLW
jgi:PIN domain nuclease of toxin-antitoxin system